LTDAGSRSLAAIILAAGAATRMGRPKQLLPYRGRTFLEHAIQQAMEAAFHPVLVVVGAHAQAVSAALGAQPVLIVRNDAWQGGMGSSIAAGVRRLETCGAAGAAVLLADQPLVTSSHLLAMTAVFNAGACDIVAAEYGGVLGVPALFRRVTFSALTALPPGAGARQLLRSGEFQAAAYPLPEAAVDIDTPQDLAALSEPSV
jgi:molybdenum cofactor cytidylyltransferase